MTAAPLKHHVVRAIALLLASILLLDLSLAQDAPAKVKVAVPTLDTTRVAAAVAKLSDQPGAQSGLVGFSLRMLEPVSIAAPSLATHGDKSLLPASTLKTITTGSALAILGADFQFPTVLQFDGKIDESTGSLSGNVFVRGSGDPTLAKDGWLGLFAEWHAALLAAGIKGIDGAIVGDDSVFTSQAISGGWSWDDIGNYYAPPVTALNFHHNTFFITFQPGAVGSLARLVSTSPEIAGLELINEMRTSTATSGDQGYVYGAPYADTYFLRGSIPKKSGKFSIKGAIPDPAWFCAQRLHLYLKAKGIVAIGEPTTARRGNFRKQGARTDMHTHLSKPLGELIHSVNHESLNLDAEAMLKAIGVTASREGATTAGAAAVAEFLQANAIDTTGFDMADGCGLSRGNAISPNQLTAALALFQNLPGAEAFRASLPVAGRSGTLKSIGGGTSAEGRIRAKSGTINRVKCYAGYVDCRSGKKAAFAIMVHQYSGTYAPIKAGIIAIMARMAEL
ncbi:MAG: D-alanyl-D-alanine carboxypeptidase/D-alanyl-D-alanine-endopeptidase (penicillin-binding protein 4) [Verrucomicrobiales bacterium]|jgi:D-alanyl-D-alanine carboxypeptidase/D-alanyl-D-alanine-endopeptidase (penicillin-binding protein 4)